MTESMERLDLGSFDRGRNVSVFFQTWILTRKNWKSKRRTEFKKLLGEIFLPVFYLIILSFLVRLNKHTVYPEVTEERETPQDVFSSLLTGNNPHLIHVVHSSETVAKEVVDLMKTAWKNSHPTISDEKVMEFKILKSTAEMLEEYSTVGNVKIAIVLSETDNQTYSLRIEPELPNYPQPSKRRAELETCRGLEKKDPGLENPGSCPVNGYYFSQFLAVQHLVDNALKMKRDGNVQWIPTNVTIENYPKAEYTPGMPTFLRVIIPLYCIIPLAQLINTLLILIVTEKENKIKDGLKMIGVSDFAYWCSWFNIYGAMAIIFAAMFTIVMHFMNVLKNFNPVILFILFMLFGLSIITFAFALTPFFHKPKTAGAVGTLVMQFSGTLFMLQTFLLDPSSSWMMPLRLFSSVAFTTALDTACAFEYNGGVSLGEILPGEKASGVLYSLIFLAFDTILYGLIAVYLDNVIPNEYGVSKHPLYFLSWSGSKHAQPIPEDFSDSASGAIELDDVEKVHPSMVGREAFRLRNIGKTYSSWFSKESTESLKGINLDIYEGQITALLGRNGAGKSTMINIMTGLAMPTTGKCVVFGLDISKPHDMMRLRKMTGVCMQQDLHFPSLTTEEHLIFYGKLRGVAREDLNVEITELLKELDLTHQRSTRAEKLSGGQKRKLSVAIALIGSPKIILLDEPSAGVDPVSRRQLWGLLQKKKHDRVILLCTHFMDEADVLADRKAIIHMGMLKCVGSSLFLKSRFGVGYQLSVELTEDNIMTSESDLIVSKWIPEALKSRQIVANEIKYTLPHSKIGIFADLFRDFEKVIKNGHSLMKSYGVSMTTLSEVFLKISNDLEVADPLKGNEAMPHRRQSSTSVQSGGSEDTNANPSPGVLNSAAGDNLIPDIDGLNFIPHVPSVFFAMCLLRIRRLIRNPQALFFMIFMPVILVIIGFAIVKVQNPGPTDTELLFSPENYRNIYSENDLNLAVQQDSDKNFQSYLNRSKISVFPYSGAFAELLQINLMKQSIGTMAAIALNSRDNRASIRMNGTFLHVPGLALNAINNYIASSNGTSFEVKTMLQPLPQKNVASFDQSTFYAVFLIGPAFTFSAVGLVMEIVNDREKQTRNHLRVNGVSFSMYFSSLFAVFGTLSCFITIMEIIVILAFNVAAFTNVYALTTTFILLLIFIMPCLLFSAAFSYFFDRMETAQTVFSQVCSWMGSLVGIAIILVDALAPQHTMLLHSIFSFLDIFYIPFGIFYFVQKEYFKCTIFGTCDHLSFESYMSKEIVIMGVAMLVQIPVYFGLLIVADVFKNGGAAGVKGLLGRWLLRGGRPRHTDFIPFNNQDADDADVQHETERVATYLHGMDSNESKCVVAVKDLRKAYKAKRKKTPTSKEKEYDREVLHGVNLMVEEGETFGLLGHNGAGKSTCLKIIIAEEKPDSGKIRLCGHDIQSNMSEAFQKLGYCPQHDALWDNITLAEHIDLYAIIRGVNPSIRKRVVDHFLQGLQIEEHSDKRANTLSGGTKRKLSYCMSILGSPKIVLLDEPSTGMDILSKRFLWNTVIGTFKDKRGAILTTHSMEEADALCSRIGIMVKGSLLCIGSPQHLKSKYGVGYLLEIKLKFNDTFEETFEPGNIGDANPTIPQRFAFVSTHFPECTLSEIFDNRAIFSIPKDSISSIADTFSLLEQVKVTQNIEEYSFCQTSLEQVYLQFAKHNEEDEEE